MTSLGSMLTQQYIATQRQARADRAAQQQQRSLEMQQAMQQAQLNNQQAQTRHDKQFEMELALAKELGRAAQLQGKDKPQLGSDGATALANVGYETAAGDSAVRDKTAMAALHQMLLKSQVEQAGRLNLEGLRQSGKVSLEGVKQGNRKEMQEDQQTFTAGQNDKRLGQQKDLFYEGQNRQDRRQTIGDTNARERAELATLDLQPRKKNIMEANESKRVASALNAQLDNLELRHQKWYNNAILSRLANFGGSLERFGLSLDEKDRAEFAAFKSQVVAMVNDYVKNQTGMSRSDKEYALMSQVMPNTDMPASTFAAVLGVLRKKAKKDFDMAHQVIQNQGLLPSSINGYGAPADMESAARKFRAENPGASNEDVADYLDGLFPDEEE